MRYPGLPPKQGLYDPQFEKDSCGVGFVANIDGTRSNRIMRQALEVLLNLSHRGACGCDPETGDGAGILLQIPHEFLSRECQKIGWTLPDPGHYGVGMVFLPRESGPREQCQSLFESVIQEEGQHLLGWRDVPVNNRAIGQKAREVEPVIRQIFVGRSLELESEAQFERKLYVIRRRVATLIEKSDHSRADHFYVCSLSCVTLIYKGLLMPDQISAFYPDLADTYVKSSLALVHSRFSTNTFPSWKLAHPYRYLAHNGEINTLRGNRNWMRARTQSLSSHLFGDDLKKLFPILTETGSDSATIDNALEFLIAGGRSLPHAIMMLIPEAWNKDIHLDPDKQGFYEYHACMMEPWDGPAAIAFTDGRRVGAVLDRNGLRPARYVVTKDGLVVMASEVGVLDIPTDRILYKGRLQPGKIFLVDTVEQRIIDDAELKSRITRQKPYRQWVDANKIDLHHLPEPNRGPEPNPHSLLVRQQAFGYTIEDLRLLMAPMAKDGEEAVGSMGTDTPLAVLSNRPQLLYNYFKQLFAQVTNPPIDSTREEMVMSLESYVGSEQNLLAETPKHCHMLKLPCPVLTNAELEKVRQVSLGDFRAVTLANDFPHLGGSRWAGPCA